MVTNKFIWDAFNKNADNLFYLDSNISVLYSDFYKSVISIATSIREKYQPNEKVALIANTNLEFLQLFFALIYNGSFPVLLSASMPQQQIDMLLKSIACTKKLTPEQIKLEPILQKIDINPIESEDASIIFTSGSSSIAKAVLHTFSNHYYSALGSNENIQLKQNDRWLLSLPMHHVGGLSILFRMLLAGASVVGYNKTLSLANIIEKFEISHISVVEAQLKKLLEEPKKLKTLQAVLAGGGQISEDLISYALNKNLPLYKTYGMSEMSSQITTTSPNAPIQDLQTSGKLLQYRELMISETSEILVRGEVLCKKYLNAKIEIDPDGWFHTGDIGSLDADNNLTVSGRVDNMFISGGENIYPESIEQIILSMDEMEEACIVPMYDGRFGQVPVLFYKTSDGEEIDSSTLLEFLQDKVQSFEIPKKIFYFPKSYKPLGIKLNRKFFKDYIEFC